MNHSATLSINTSTASSSSRVAFARHFGEMVLVMFLGMVVLGGLGELAFAASGSSLGDQPGGLQVTLMGLAMTVPTVVWMAYRGHTVNQNAEMAGSMVIPTILSAVLVWTGAIDSATGLGIQHGVMLPAMLGVMLWRYDEYAHVH